MVQLGKRKAGDMKQWKSKVQPWKRKTSAREQITKQTWCFISIQPEVLCFLHVPDDFIGYKFWLDLWATFLESQTIQPTSWYQFWEISVKENWSGYQCRYIHIYLHIWIHIFSVFLILLTFFINFSTLFILFSIYLYTHPMFIRPIRIYITWTVWKNW